MIPQGHVQCLLPTTLVGSREWGDGEGLRKLFSGAAAGGAAERRGRGVLFAQTCGNGFLRGLSLVLRGCLPPGPLLEADSGFPARCSLKEIFWEGFESHF